MYRELYSNERYWVETMLKVEFKGKEYLLKQMLNSQVSVEQGYDYISIRFKSTEDEKFPYHVRVPVEMRAFQNDSVPIVFLLHIIDGVIDELELITADSSKINPDTIQLDKLEYVIHEQVMI